MAEIDKSIEELEAEVMAELESAETSETPIMEESEVEESTEEEEVNLYLCNFFNK